jgi:hypothetical protein
VVSAEAVESVIRGSILGEKWRLLCSWLWHWKGLFLKDVYRVVCGRKKNVRRPGIEPGSAIWNMTVLTVRPPTLVGEDAHPEMPSLVSSDQRRRRRMQTDRQLF